MCDEGYEPARLELQCVNVDECQDGTPRCSHGHCVDDDGSWYCECQARVRKTGYAKILKMRFSQCQNLIKKNRRKLS